LSEGTATCRDDTGIDPFSRQAAFVARGLRGRKMQRALKQFFNPENYFTVRGALVQARQQGLIGSDCGAAYPNPAAWQRSAGSTQTVETYTGESARSTRKCKASQD
jgi:hypothetical protein